MRFITPPPEPGVPGIDQVDVWKASLELPASIVDRLESFLDQEELERARRFVFERDKNFFIAGRGLLRLLLAVYLGIPPASVRFFYNREGRPFLESPRGDAFGPFFFNLSHSRGRVVFAFSREKQTGIDIEIPRDEIDFLGIADFFREAEARHLRETPPASLRTEFLRLWTGKEAILKAIGTGLSMELSSLEIMAGAGSLTTVLVKNNEAEARYWRIYELDPWPEGRCSLALRRPEPLDLRLYDLTTEWINQATPGS